MPESLPNKTNSEPQSNTNSFKSLVNFIKKYDRLPSEYILEHGLCPQVSRELILEESSLIQRIKWIEAYTEKGTTFNYYLKHK